MITTALPALDPNLAKIRLAIRSLQPRLVDWRRSLHQRPELGFQERWTAAFIERQLTEWGVPHQTGIAETGIVAVIVGEAPAAGPSRTIAIRADMDALPVQEENEVAYRSQHDGLMHACGHDGHTAIALGTVYYLWQQRQQLCGTVKVIFQPAEEGPGGAKPMIAAGVLKNPDVEAIVGLHLWNNLPLGQVGVREGALMAAVEVFDCVIQGKGGHGAIPQQTVDAIVVAAQAVNALQTIVSRQVDPLKAGVVTIGSLHAGHTHNVIAATAKLQGTVRYFDPQLSGFFEQRMRQILDGVCLSSGATYTLNYQALYPPVINDRQIAALVRSAAETVVETPVGELPNCHIVPDCQTMGGEDMSFFLQEVPGCYFFLGSANAAKNLAFPHHHPRFDFDETALGMGVELFVRCVESFCQSQL